MREQRRKLPRTVSPLEMLDDRIVPSAVGMTPRPHAAMAEHSAVHQRMQHSTQAHLHLRRPRLQLRLHGHHARARFQAQHVPGGPMAMASASAQLNPGPASPVSVGTMSQAVPTAVSASSGAPAQALPAMASVSTGAVAPASASARVSGGGLGAAIIPGNTNATTSATTTTTTTTPTIEQIKTGPLAKAGQDLITIFEEFQQQGSGSTFTSSKAGLVEIQGTNVGVSIRSTGGNFNALVAKLNGLGFQTRTQDPMSGTISGLLPIAQIATVAGDAQVQSMSAIYSPRTGSFSMQLGGLH